VFAPQSCGYNQSTMSEWEDFRPDLTNIERSSQLANKLSIEYSMLISIGADPSIVALSRVIPFDLLTTTPAEPERERVDRAGRELLTYDELVLWGVIRKRKRAPFLEEDLRKQTGTSDVHGLLLEMCRKRYVESVGPSTWREIVPEKPKEVAEKPKDEEEEQFYRLIQATRFMWYQLEAEIFSQKEIETGSRRWRPALATRRLTRAGLNSEFELFFSAMSEALRVIGEQDRNEREGRPGSIETDKDKAELFKIRADIFKTLVDGCLTLAKAILTATAGVSLLVGTLHITSPMARDGIRRISATVLSPEKAYEIWTDDARDLREHLGGDVTVKDVTRKGDNAEITIEVRVANK
jgi:hypothetical protein